ncbi:MAG TPA: nicotinamide-nucleotide amidase [Burkholderiales bacterium]|nr:nicotinamide-nucleotide amidase [Burkholderiales bacterium]
MTDPQLYELAERVGKALKAKGMMMASAESCTGGWIAQAMTAVPGSSAWFERAFVTYTNIAKQEMLGVKTATLDAHGAVSEPVVREMVEGALARSHAQVAVSVSGVAGPTGGTPEKPVGMVCFGWGVKGGAIQTATLHFDGDREAVRRQSVAFALNQILAL